MKTTMVGGVSKLVPKPAYSPQAEAMLRRCPRWQRRPFQRAILKRGSAVIRRYRAARRVWDPDRLGVTIFQWVLLRIEGYIAIINAVGKTLMVHAIFAESDASQRPFVQWAFAVLRNPRSGTVTRVIELTLVSRVTDTLLVMVYSLGGKRPRLRRLPVAEDIDVMSVVTNAIQCKS